jgi:membrane protein YdbS with pleckstrin-like domain
MGYAEKNLAPGEAILYRARYHWMIYRGSIALAVFGTLFGVAALFARSHAPDPAPAFEIVAALLLVLALVAFAARRVRAGADEFVVTSRRVMRRVGLFSREIEHAPIEKIQDITIQQGWPGSLLGYGTVLLETASERGTLVFPEIAEPEAFRTAIWGQAPSAGSAVGGRAIPSRDRLAELEGLKQQGLVTEEEYAAKRREILASL